MKGPSPRTITRPRSSAAATRKASANRVSAGLNEWGITASPTTKSLVPGLNTCRPSRTRRINTRCFFTWRRNSSSTESPNSEPKNPHEYSWYFRELQLRVGRPHQGLRGRIGEPERAQPAAVFEQRDPFACEAAVFHGQHAMLDRHRIVNARSPVDRVGHFEPGPDDAIQFDWAERHRADARRRQAFNEAARLQIGETAHYQHEAEQHARNRKNRNEQQQRVGIHRRER
jgi:hypothetical protein